MRWTAFLLVGMSMSIAGCQQAPESQSLKKVPEVNVPAVSAEILALNAKVADKVSRAEDLESFVKALEDRFDIDQEIRYKLEPLSEKDQARISELTSSQIEDAVAVFHRRMIKQGPTPQVVIDTSMGPIKAELYEALAPITVKNFLRYVDNGFYDGTIFHRVKPTFMIQGGGFEPGMREKKTYGAIKNESYNRLQNLRGTLAMARTSDPDSATAQFFINIPNNNFLDRAQEGVGYAVFGKVIDGMDVVDKIKFSPTGSRGGHDDVPTTDVLIKSVRRVDEKK